MIKQVNIWTFTSQKHLMCRPTRGVGRHIRYFCDVNVNLFKGSCNDYPVQLIKWYRPDNHQNTLKTQR